MGSLQKINHVVVLMLENRSFDNMLGRLYPPGAKDFYGLTGNETNPDGSGGTIKVWNDAGTDPTTMEIPDPDPGELWTDMNQQIFGTQIVPPPTPPTMQGFVENYLYQATLPENAGTSYPAKAIMHYFNPDQVPVISTLATSFGVSDQWFAAAPCQTWPNRFFTHCATANGYENNEPYHFPYKMPTIFSRFSSSRDWKIYFNEIPQALALAELWRHPFNFQYIEWFKIDCRLGRLPAYSFIEPRYFSDLLPANDEHPPHNVSYGEQLIAEVYNSLRKSPLWKQTLLIITYDEHGGCYDHFPPARNAPPPSQTVTHPFNFDRYGVRVPAVLVSPYIAPGSIIRANDPNKPHPFDHTSIIATLRKRFDLGAALTDRDASAPDLDVALALDKADNMGPERVDALPHAPTPSQMAQVRALPLNDLQRSLVAIAAHLPASIRETEAQVQQLQAGVAAPMPDLATLTRAEGATFIKNRLDRFFGSE